MGAIKQTKMSDVKIEKGDIVKLKSGSPTMTVRNNVWDASKGVYKQDEVHCDWFNGGEPQSKSFKIEQLIKV